MTTRRVAFSSDLLETVGDDQLIQFINARVLRQGKLCPNEHLWVCFLPSIVHSFSIYFYG